MHTNMDEKANEDDIARMPMWKSYLYHLQQQAPKPKRIVCQREVGSKPPYYGREYHGAISREDTDFLLTIGGEGSYLIRESQRAPGQYTLAIRFESVTKNFKLYYDGQHYVGEKRFDTVQDLVADGLITFYLESKAADYIAQLSNQSNYAESPYVAYNTLKKKQLAAPRSLSRSLRSHSHHHHSHHKGERTERSGEKTERGERSEGGERADRSPSVGAEGGRTRKSANIPVEGRVSQILENRQDANQNINIATKDSNQVQSSHASPLPAAAKSGAGREQQQPQAQSQQGTPQPNRQSHVQSSPALEGRQPNAKSNQTDQQHHGDHDHHEYVNQTQINLHRQSQLEAKAAREQQQQQQQQSPKASPNQVQRKHEASTSQHPNAQQQQKNMVGARHTTYAGHDGVASPGLITPEEDMPDLGRVSSSTNTDGPRPNKRRESAPPKVDVERQKREILEAKKRHNFKMFEEPHFTTPPSSPIPLHALDHLKFSNVSWCTDFLEVLGCEKPHNFKQTTFKGPHWCDFCANFLWGLIAQGVKCQDCGFNAHKKCSEKVPNDCMPDMKYVKRIFGVDLTTLVKAQNTLIPVVVEKCITEIEKRGIESEGLYRVAGFHDDVEAIKMSFDKDADLTDISEERYDDINTITSLLKLYFRLLPIPLITFDVYFKLIDIVKRDIGHDQMLEQLRQILPLLPPAHYHTLKYLMAHLHRVTEKQSKNMMNPENLAIVFAPTLLRSPENDPLSGLTAVKFERELIELIMGHQGSLFE